MRQLIILAIALMALGTNASVVTYTESNQVEYQVKTGAVVIVLDGKQEFILDLINCKASFNSKSKFENHVVILDQNGTIAFEETFTIPVLTISTKNFAVGQYTVFLSGQGCTLSASFLK